MSKLILDKVLPEHFGYPNPIAFESDLEGLRSENHFKGNKDKACYTISNSNEEKFISTSFFIGVDWVKKGELAIQVEPKLSDNSKRTDYLKMLSGVMKHPEVTSFVSDIFEIKYDSEPISIEQKNDFITPLLIIQYVNVLKQIVRKGLKKSYRKTEENLHSKVKGKILVGATIKENVFKNKTLSTKCQFETFDEDNIENRLLKKALSFAKRYFSTIGLELDIESLNYINPAFINVSENASINELQQVRLNPFYKEYGEGLKLAKLILQRYGYNINSIDKTEKVLTPPFWIDMSLLFELYAYKILADKFDSNIVFQFKAKYGFPDFLIPSIKTVADAKYKTSYNKIKEGKGPISEVINDIRQVSAYSRDIKIRERLTANDSEMLACLLLYPSKYGIENSDELDLRKERIQQFEGFYKLGIKLPIQE